jgi:hypothetical protein
MPNQRRAGMTPVSFSASESLMELVDRVAASMFKERSQFVREALAEKLRSMGHEVSPDMFHVPPRFAVRVAEDQSAPTPQGKKSVDYKKVIAADKKRAKKRSSD